MGDTVARAEISERSTSILVPGKLIKRDKGRHVCKGSVNQTSKISVEEGMKKFRIAKVSLAGQYTTRGGDLGLALLVARGYPMVMRAVKTTV